MTADVGRDVMRPSSFSTSFMAAKIGRSGQPVQNPGGRGGTDLGKRLELVVRIRRRIGRARLV